jgi:ABC-type sugar transport system permease subunit
MVEPGTIEHFGQILSHVVAPAFLLGAVASFTAILLARVEKVLDRIRMINDIPSNGHSKSGLKSDIPRLKRRLKLLNASLYLAIWSGIIAGVLIIGAFVAALLTISHVWGAAVAFTLSMLLLCISLFVFAMEVRISLNEQEEY